MKDNSIPQKILLTLGDITKDVLKVSVDIIFNPRVILKGYSLYNNQSLCSPAFYRGVHVLKKNGYLIEKKNKNNICLALTSKGRMTIIKNILKKKKSKELKWDEKWRAVIFDIPELKRRDRDFLRRELQWIGFKELQKSVWVFPYDFEKELKTLLKYWKIEFGGDIRFLTIEKIDDQDIKKYFKLK